MDKEIVAILNSLLSKYEKSKTFKKGSSSRRIILKGDDKTVKIAIDKKGPSEFSKELKILELENFITYKEERGFDNVIEAIYLNTEKSSLDRLYKVLNRKSLEDEIEQVLQYLRASGYNTSSKVGSYIEKEILYIENNKKLPYYFKNNEEGKAIAKALSFISNNSEIITERAFSLKLFKDSKYFEKNIKNKIITILNSIEDDESENILEYYSIFRYPEIIEFTGPISITFKDNKTIDFSPLSNGAYINSLDIDQFNKIDGYIKKVVFIENKANYVQMCKNKEPNTLYILHGGMYSSAKAKFFNIIYQSFKCSNFYHTGDIDLGGFKIFNRLKSNIIPTLCPLNMDVETLLKYIDCAKSEQRDSYLVNLKTLLNDDDYKVFHEVIKLMLDKKIKLEQEAFLIEHGN